MASFMTRTLSISSSSTIEYGYVCASMKCVPAMCCAAIESNLMHEKAFTSISNSFFYEIRIDVRIGVSWKVVHGIGCCFHGLVLFSVYNVS